MTFQLMYSFRCLHSLIKKSQKKGSEFTVVDYNYNFLLKPVRKVIKSANLNYVDMGFRPRTNNECPLPSLRVHAK